MSEDTEAAFNARLARMIREYWKARGYDVTVKPVALSFIQPYRCAPNTMKSNLKDGLPQPPQDPHWSM